MMPELSPLLSLVSYLPEDGVRVSDLLGAAALVHGDRLRCLSAIHLAMTSGYAELSRTEGPGVLWHLLTSQGTVEGRDLSLAVAHLLPGDSGSQEDYFQDASLFPTPAGENVQWQNETQMRFQEVEAMLNGITVPGSLPDPSRPFVLLAACALGAMAATDDERSFRIAAQQLGTYVERGSMLLYVGPYRIAQSASSQFLLRCARTFGPYDPALRTIAFTRP